jgi:hypothetical protein
MSRIATRWLIGAFAFLSAVIAVPLYAAEGNVPAVSQQGTATPATPGTDEKSPAATGADTGGAGDSATSPSAAAPNTGEPAKPDTPQASDEAFIPSETISEDFNVAFPVDI